MFILISFLFNQNKEMIRAGASVLKNSQDMFKRTPLDLAVRQGYRVCASILLDIEGKLNQEKSPWWLDKLVEKRKKVQKVVTIMYGVLRKRFQVHDKSTAHIGYRIPTEIAKLLSWYAWETRLQKEWDEK